MAFDFSNSAISTTFNAGADLSSAQYKFVKVEAVTGDVILVAGATDRPVGVLQNAPKENEAAQVTIAGGTKVQAGGVAAAGNSLYSSAAGLAVTLVEGGTGAAAYVVGTYLETTANATITSAVINCASAARGQ